MKGAVGRGFLKAFSCISSGWNWISMKASFPKHLQVKCTFSVSISSYCLTEERVFAGAAAQFGMLQISRF